MTTRNEVKFQKCVSILSQLYNCVAFALKKPMMRLENRKNVEKMSKGKQTGFHRKKIVWISFLFLDSARALYKTSRIEVLRHLAKRGHEVFLIAVHSKESLRKAEITDVNVISIPLRYLAYFSNVIFVLLLFFFLPFYFLYLKPDLVIIEPEPTILSLAPTLLFPRSKRPKIILDIRSTLYFGGIGGSREYITASFFNIAIYIAKKLFDGITTITPLMRKEICDKFHISPKHVGVWTDGVSATLFKPESYDGIEMRKRLGLNDKFVIFYHGTFGKKRGIIEIIQSIQILKSKYHDLVLFLLGNGWALPLMKNLIQKSGIQDRVIIHDTVSYVDVPKYIAICDLGIVALPDLPQWRRQCPLKLLEYLAMKKAVIATDIPANREVMGRSKCGIYTSSADPMEIAKAITYAYNNKEKLNKWGSYGRPIVEERYNWRKVAEDLENYLLKL